MSEAMTGERDSRPTPADATAPTDDGARDSPRVIRSDALLRGDSQLAILHDQTVYFLRKTRFGKLILTK